MTSKTDVSKIPRQGQRREDYSLTRPLDVSVASTRSTRTRQHQHPAHTNTPTSSICPTHGHSGRLVAIAPGLATISTTHNTTQLSRLPLPPPPPNSPPNSISPPPRLSGGCVSISPGPETISPPPNTPR